MPLLTRSKPADPARTKKLHRLHVVARMNTFAAKAKAVHAELAARLILHEAREALAADVAEAERFRDALGVFLKAIDTPR